MLCSCITCSLARNHLDSNYHEHPLVSIIHPKINCQTPCMIYSYVPYRLKNPLRSPFGMYGRMTRMGSLLVTTLSRPRTLGWRNLASIWASLRKSFFTMSDDPSKKVDRCAGITAALLLGEKHVLKVIYLSTFSLQQCFLAVQESFP